MCMECDEFKERYRKVISEKKGQERRDQLNTLLREILCISYFDMHRFIKHAEK